MTVPSQHSAYRADPALTAMAAERAENFWTARSIVTPIPSNVLSARIRTYGDEQRIGVGGPSGAASLATTYLDGLTNIGGDYTPTGLSVGTLSFDCLEYGFSSFVSDIDAEEERNSFGGDLRVAHATTVMNRLNKACEVRREANMMSTTNFSNNAATTATYDGGGSPDFLADVDAGKDSLKQTGGVADSEILMVIPPDTFQALKQLTEIVSLLSGYDPRAAQLGQDDVWIEVIRQYAGVGRVVVPFAIENTATEGQTVSAGYVWGTDNIFMGKVPTAADPNSAYIEVRYNAAGFSDGRKMWRYRNTRNTGETVEFGEIVDDIYRAEYGYLITNTLA